MFDQSRIPFDKVKTDRVFSDQGYLSDQSECDGYKLHDFGPAFNMVGSQILRVADVSTISRNVFILNITSVVQDRLGVARQMDGLLRQRYPRAAVRAEWPAAE
jgi:hypothetical protein